MAKVTTGTGDRALPSYVFQQGCPLHPARLRQADDHCLYVFIKPRDQSKNMEYADSGGSCVTRVKPAWWAWAMSRQSKGSLWCRSKLSRA